MGRTQRHRLQRAKISDEDSGSLRNLYIHLNSLGWQNHTHLSAQTYTLTGRGLCSKKETFSQEDELIRLPVGCLISIATLESDEQFKSLFDKELFDKDSRISFQALVACYLLYLKHLKECSLETLQPVYTAYLETLPKTYSTPYFCSIPELQCLPESVLERTVGQNRQIRRYFEIIKSLVTSCDCCGKSYGQDIFTLAEFKWAYFTTNTRSVYLSSRFLKKQCSHFQALISSDTNLALAPFLDLFNHSDSVQTTAEIEGKDYVLTLKTLPYSKTKSYEQLFISYGALSNFKLLTEYGFCLKGNKHDYFEISLLDIEHMVKNNKVLSTQTYHRNIFKFIREHNLNDQMFVHINDGCSHNLRVVLHLIFKQQAYFPNILNQIAFGDVEQFEDVQPELSQLVAFKIKEYEIFGGELDKLPKLTESGLVARFYLKECIRYLNDFQVAHPRE
ncbi:SET domain-containing protein 4 [Drosophila eugracilis]|uniref:SET domain-containing protein 4 n=1 Tax=Drosophila eugracilis TaxID=29029 RepID=UPI0007E69BFC|nr:SET domain-containing protein 4 [Drosophila eugracilis]XP_017063484.1 SET domain-containing protein 4 [Drosophila eugracilis]